MTTHRRELAERLNQQGIEAEEAGRRDDAVRFYEEAAAEDPTWATPLYNLGLLYKYEGQWDRSLELNLKAVTIDPGKDGAYWNLGIAATAMGDWRLARTAWRKFGVEVGEGCEPIEVRCGRCPIRINPNADAEVVWAERIDPARAILESIPFAESGHGWRDMVLNDGAPNGYRLHDGVEVPVFDELQHLQRSQFGTFVSKVLLKDAQQSTDRLCEVASALGGAAEDWSASTRMLCKQCSEGRVHAKHDQENDLPERERTVAVAARSCEHAERIVQAWREELPDAVVELGECALEPGTFN